MKIKNRSTKLLAITIVAAALFLEVASRSGAVTVISGPFFSPASNAPLAGTLTLSTDANSLVSVSVQDGTGSWVRNFFDYGTNHSEILLGFKANQTNRITVTVRDQNRSTFTVAGQIAFVTAPLPTNMPAITLRTNNIDKMEPGYTMFRVDNLGATSYVTIVDKSGVVVWYSSALPTPSDVRQLSNGDLFFPTTGNVGFGQGNGFTEGNMLGEVVNSWIAPTSVDDHEDLMTDHGTILYLNYSTEVVSNFPNSVTDQEAGTTNASVTCATVIEMSATNSELLDSWPLIDMLDPVRIDYLCFQIESLYGIDPEHANAVIEDPSDNSLIVSLRNQDAIVKFSRTGQIKWILGPHENWGPEWQPYLLTPVGDPFEWNYAQHAPYLTAQGTLLCYDDGKSRAEPFDLPVADPDNYSRAAEFRIDETNMQVSQVWEFSDTNSDRLYTPALGSAIYLPHTSNVLVNFGYVAYENGNTPDPIAPGATTVRIREVTHEANPTVVFDLELSNPSVVSLK